MSYTPPCDQGLRTLRAGVGPRLGVIVTLSASYGAGGDHVGREVARRLDARFLDRAIPAEVAQRLAVPLERVLAHDERAPAPLERMIGALAPLAPWYAPGASGRKGGEPDLRAATERLLHEAADSGSAVLLGRAAAVVLGELPHALHVRLDGTPERRVEQACRLENIDPGSARRRMRETDRARNAYVHHLYGADAGDPRLYHLVLDSTALDLPACADLIVRAAHARSSRSRALRPLGRHGEHR